MARIDVYDTKGKKTGKIQLPKEIFGAKINEQLMTQAVRVYLANQRRAGAKTKTRGEVIGSGRKIYRQKGTGRARHGDRYAPIFVGGGRAHGPTGRENWQLKIAKKMKRRALFSALTSKLKEKNLIIIEGLEKIKPKTKIMTKVLAIITNRRLGNAKAQKEKKTQKILLVLPEKIENVIRAAKNIAGVKLTQANLLNAYEVLNGGKLIVTKDSIKVLKETFLS